MVFIETKDNVGNVTDVDEKGMRVSGYLADFDTKDSHGDIIVKGAFKKSIAENKEDIWFLNQHRWDQPHGGIDVLEEDSKGLRFVSKPMVKGVTYSEDAIKLYMAGVLKNHSFGYNTIKSNFDKKSDARILTELKLWEGSNVTIGSNQNTPFTGFKSIIEEADTLEKEYKTFLKAYRTGTFTDDTFRLLEIALKDMLKRSNELGKKEALEAKEEPQESTLITKAEPLELTNTIKNFTQLI